jgi:hypothetical protein
MKDTQRELNVGELVLYKLGTNHAQFAKVAAYVPQSQCYSISPVLKNTLGICLPAKRETLYPVDDLIDDLDALESFRDGMGSLGAISNEKQAQHPAVTLKVMSVTSSLHSEAVKVRGIGPIQYPGCDSGGDVFSTFEVDLATACVKGYFQPEDIVDVSFKKRPQQPERSQAQYCSEI